jgi:hypothetical protein
VSFTTAPAIIATGLIGSVTVLCPPLSLGAGTEPPFGTAHFATPDLKPLLSPKIMLTAVELDQRRSDFMEMLHQHYEANNLLTGLWERFAYESAANLRDLDYNILRSDLVRAFGNTDSDLANRYADAAITVLIGHLLPQRG